MQDFPDEVQNQVFLIRFLDDYIIEVFNHGQRDLASQAADECIDIIAGLPDEVRDFDEVKNCLQTATRHRALIRAHAGDEDGAREDLDRARAAHPEGMEGWPSEIYLAAWLGRTEDVFAEALRIGAESNLTGLRCFYVAHAASHLLRRLMENNGDDAAVSDEHAELVELSIAWLRRSDELGFFDEASNRYLLATFDSFQQLQYHEFVQGVLSRPIDAVPEADSESVENDSSDQ